MLRNMGAFHESGRGWSRLLATGTNTVSDTQPPNPMLYYICRMNDQGQWEGLRSTCEKDYAEALYRYFCKTSPTAYLDILTHDEYHGGEAKWKEMAMTSV